MHEIPASFIQPIYIYLYRSSHAVVGYFLKKAALLFLPFLRNVIFTFLLVSLKLKLPQALAIFTEKFVITCTRTSSPNNSLCC
jgi:hypothetical protein